MEKQDEHLYEFSKEIERYEDVMFGLMLYQETSPEWVKKAQGKSYKNIKNRGEEALEEAREILRKAEKGKSVKDKIVNFEWPLIIEEMQYRIDVMLKSYKSLFPDRPRKKKLSEREIILLRNEAMRNIQFYAGAKHRSK